MKLSVSIGLVYICCSVFQSNSFTGYSSETGNLEYWQHDQYEHLALIFEQWTDSVAQEFLASLSKMQQKRVNDCAETTEALNLFLAKLKRELLSLNEKLINGVQSTSEAYQILEKIVARSKFIAEESRTESEGECVRNFRRKHAELSQNIASFHEKLKLYKRNESIIATIQNMKRKNLEVITNLMETSDPDLETFLPEVIEQLLPDFNATQTNFVHLVWLIGNLGTQSQKSSTLLLELALEKLTTFDLLPSNYTLRLAYLARITQAPLKIIRQFPGQIQNLFWAKMNCIKNQHGQLVLREEGYPINFQNFKSNSTTLELRSRKEALGPGLEMTQEKCGWEVSLQPGGFNVPILFKLYRKVNDPGRTWSLIKDVQGQIVLISAQANENLFEIIPTRYQRTGEPNTDPVEFKLSPYSKNSTGNESICRGRLVSMRSGGASAPVKLSFDSEADCRWILTKTV